MSESRPGLSKEWKSLFRGPAKRPGTDRAEGEAAMQGVKRRNNDSLIANDSKRGRTTGKHPKNSVITQWLSRPSTKAELPANAVAGKDEEDRYFSGEMWWIQPEGIKSSEKCNFVNCTFEPTAHRSHYRDVKLLSLVEKKIIVKYLILTNSIEKAKGQKIYQNMIKDGYLSHRSWETLRNCFCKTILCEIEKYQLNQRTLAEFLKLKKNESAQNKFINIIKNAV